MKQRIAFLIVSALLIAAIIFFPGSKKIERVFEATEYSFSDPDYTVTHTITAEGYDTRNLFGRGHYEGTFAVESWELAQAGWRLYAKFPIPAHYWNSTSVHPSGYHTSSEILCFLPNRNWTSFVCLIQEIEVDASGSKHGSFDPESGRFMVCGSLTREEALEEAYHLSKGTLLEPLFTNR